MSKSAAFDLKSGLEIAIIGMSGRFPGSKDVNEFWRNLLDGVESISFFTDQEFESSGIDHAVLSNPNYVKARGVLQDIELFDASFFGLNPREAEIMEPQHRIFLECAWEALESAGYDSEAYEGQIGVYAGVRMNTYLLNNLYSNRDLLESVGEFQTMMANDKDFVTTRLSYKLNLRGPSVVVQTACSTSLVAVCLACQSLLSGECDIALAGGVSISVPQKRGYFYHEGGISSPDGHCRAFDAKARGTVWSDGVGLIVLKRLEEALTDGDCIHAVIKGSAINNDGSLKAGYTAPSVDGQAKVIRSAQIMAEVESETITYVETHGTGTSLGDPIEIAALTQAFRTSTQRKGFCAIGSVKTNIGHTEMAAGVAGLIKTVLMLKHKMIPSSLHFEEPNPEIDFENSPFYVNTKLSEWKVDGFPRRAGVSAFGFGGTNAHVVLEEAATLETSDKSRPLQLLLLSGQTSTALDKRTTDLLEHLRESPHLNLADVAYTLHNGRKAFDYRRMLVCQSLDDAVRSLETLDPERVFTFFQEPINRDIVFMFPGQGSQYVNMGLALYTNESQFREQIDRCSEILQPHLGLDLRGVLYPHEKDVEKASQRLRQTSITQPALFVIEFALAKLWMSWGVNPKALVGHSIGEYVAACLAGIFSLEDALSLIATRGRLMQELRGGSMLAVSLSEKEIEPLLGEKLSLAAINAPFFCVVSGEKDAVEDLEEELSKKKVECRHLHTSHAFHSKMMQPILDAFIDEANLLSFNPPQISIVSTVTGTWVTPDEIMNPGYWAKNVRQTVRFSDCVEELLKEPSRILLEVGPGQTLSTLARQHPNKAKEQILVSSIRHPNEQKSDIAFILNTLGRLWLAGVQPDWSGFHRDEMCHRIPLPTYPFERRRYWIEPQQQVQATSVVHKLANKKSDLDEWFYVPSWKRSQLQRLQGRKALYDQKLCWLVFLDECGLGIKLVKQLQEDGQHVTTVKAGEQFDQVNEGAYTVNPQAQEDYNRLLKELRAAKRTPNTIVHLWSVTRGEGISSGNNFLEFFQDLGFKSLLFLVQSIGDCLSHDPVQIKVISNHLQEVTGEEVLAPEKATLLGPCLVASQEYPNIQCTSVDILLPKPGTQQEEELKELLMEELATQTSALIVAYRGKRRWVQTFEAVRLEKVAELKPRIRDNGVYLITGGLGGIGLVLAEYLAQTVQPKLVLIGRSSLPQRGQWEPWLKTHGEEDAVSQKIRKVQSIEGLGAEVLTVCADVADTDQMKKAIGQAYDRFGEIHGVIHAAGIAGGGVMQLKTPEAAEAVFAPKVKGTIVLYRLLSGVKLDFFVLCSSIKSVLGGIGQVDYCAANAFLDAYAHRYHAWSSVTSINWCTWQEVGMAVNTTVPDNLREERERDLELGILSEEGKEAFSRILGNSFPQVVVSTQDFLALVELSKEIPASGSVEKTVKTSLAKPTHARPNLSSVYVVPGNPTEQTIAEIWQQLLGVEKVGIHDNFFELGGHSLLATQVIDRLRSAFGVGFPLVSLFERPTVYSLSKMILQEQKGAPSFVESRSRGQKRKERQLRR